MFLEELWSVVILYLFFLKSFSLKVCCKNISALFYKQVKKFFRKAKTIYQMKSCFLFIKPDLLRTHKARSLENCLETPWVYLLFIFWHCILLSFLKSLYKTNTIVPLTKDTARLGDKGRKKEKVKLENCCFYLSLSFWKKDRWKDHTVLSHEPVSDSEDQTQQ